MSVPQPLLKQAIALEVQQTQQVLSRQLRLPVPRLEQIEIQQVEIDLQEPIALQQQPGLHIRGTYDLTLHLQGHQTTQTGNPFEIYLQQQPNRQGWKLAEKSIDGSNWLTTALSPS
ncbi:MAG: hypothetical protein VKJ24_12495 [Synechococcales bacterium]|nr:hypothetical protein [Synechococcales bacterium]